MTPSQARKAGWKSADNIIENFPHEKPQGALSVTLGSEMRLWRVGWGRISSKPVKCIELGNGEIKVVGSCMIKQKRDDRNESYHDTYKAAMLRFLTDAQRDVNEAKKKLANAQSRLKSANTKWMSYCASPNDEVSNPGVKNQQPKE